jgi:hypothetical protein
MTDSKGYVKREFVDLSDVNVHFRWEPQIPFMLREFKYYGLSDKYMGNVKKIIAEEEKYLKEKEAKLLLLFTRKPKSKSQSKLVSKIVKTKNVDQITHITKRRKTKIVKPVNKK